MQVFLGLISGSILSLLTTAIIGVAHLREQSRRLQVILLGQLNNLEGHCLASARSLREGNRELIVRLRLSKYGEISSLNEAMTKVGFLDEKIIEKLIGLSLKIRNNDIEIERALERIAEKDNTVDLEAIAGRVARAGKHSAELAAALRSIELPFWWPLQIKPRRFLRLRKATIALCNLRPRNGQQMSGDDKREPDH